MRKSYELLTPPSVSCDDGSFSGCGECLIWASHHIIGQPTISTSRSQECPSGVNGTFVNCDVGSVWVIECGRAIPIRNSNAGSHSISIGDLYRAIGIDTCPKWIIDRSASASRRASHPRITCCSLGVKCPSADCP